MNPLAEAASFLWSSVNLLRGGLVRAGVIRPSSIEPLVISVGNLQAGGTGKTPIVVWIAKQALALNLRVAILTRGYRSRRENSGGFLPPGPEPADAREFGDEAALIHERVPEAWIAVGSDRRKSWSELDAEIDVVILDDGFQNHQIAADVKLVLISTTSQTKVFRDFAFRARAADLLLWTKGEIAPVTYGRPLCRLSLEPVEQPSTPAYFLVCGIADPGSLNAVLSRWTSRKVGQAIFSDHHVYSREEVSAWISAAEADGTTLVTTGKDWVKIRPFVASSARKQWLVIEPQVKMIWGQETWERVVGTALGKRMRAKEKR